MHGSYGLVWILKDLAFPDPSWQHRITIGGGINAFLGVLGWYWVFSWLLISGVSQPAYPLPDYAWFCLCLSLCIRGCVIMIAADTQKYFTLRVRRGLITDGMLRYIRHPNYLGEMMIYGSFALMVWHWLLVVVLAWVWGGLFAVNMTLKEAGLSRYPEWAQYKKRSWWLLPLVLLGRRRSKVGSWVKYPAHLHLLAEIDHQQAYEAIDSVPSVNRDLRRDSARRSLRGVDRVPARGRGGVEPPPSAAAPSAY